VFESRFKHDVRNNCLMTIDGTDYRIQQKGVAKKGNLFGSHKYGGKSALQYELGIDILAGNLVSVSGPDVSQFSVLYGYVFFGAPDQGQTLDVYRSDF
jgi:hypothetical protein